VVNELGFAILKYRDKTPILAACQRCRLKFLTPLGMNDVTSAENYLLEKYTKHHCKTATAANQGEADETRREIDTVALRKHGPRKAQ
jgi:hypothetical protein